MKKGFTLIELLIVVAIIAILAAIAVPNFIEAQTRAKVSRAKADMRSIATALEAYAVDYNVHPGAYQFGGNSLRVIWSTSVTIGPIGPVGGITTPVSYMTTLPGDPFSTFLSATAAVKPGIVPFGYDKAGFGFQTTQLFPNTTNVWDQVRANQETAAGGLGAGFVVQLPNDFMTAGVDANGPVQAANQRRLPDQTPRRYVLWSTGPADDVQARPGDSATSRYIIDSRYDPTNGTVSYGFLLNYSGGPVFP